MCCQALRRLWTPRNVAKKRTLGHSLARSMVEEARNTGQRLAMCRFGRFRETQPETARSKRAGGNTEAGIKEHAAGKREPWNARRSRASAAGLAQKQDSRDHRTNHKKRAENVFVGRQPRLRGRKSSAQHQFRTRHRQSRPGGFPRRFYHCHCGIRRRFCRRPRCRACRRSQSQDRSRFHRTSMVHRSERSGNGRSCRRRGCRNGSRRGSRRGSGSASDCERGPRVRSARSGRGGWFSLWQGSRSRSLDRALPGRRFWWNPELPAPFLLFALHTKRSSRRNWEPASLALAQMAQYGRHVTLVRLRRLRQFGVHTGRRPEQNFLRGEGWRS